MKVGRRRISGKIYKIVGGRLTISMIHKFLPEFIKISQKLLIQCFLQKSLLAIPRKKILQNLILSSVYEKEQLIISSLRLKELRQTKVQNIIYQRKLIRSYLAIPTKVCYQWSYKHRMKYIKFVRSLEKKQYRKSKNHCWENKESDL